MNELPVIFRSLMRKKAVWFLTAFQIGLTLAVLVNSYASIDGFGKLIADNMGIDADNLLTVEVDIDEPADTDVYYSSDRFFENAIQDNYDLLRSIPEVENISVTNGLPFSDNARTHRVKRRHQDNVSTHVTLYTADEKFLNALGVNVTSGRNFSRSEVSWVSSNLEAGSNPVIVVSQELANTLYPDENPLNQKISISDQYFTIVGVADRLPGLHPLWTNVELSAVVPGKLASNDSKFVVRISDNSDMESVMSQMEEAFFLAPEKRIVHVKTLTDAKRSTLNNALATLKILGSVTVLLILVSILGVYGQTAFNVARKTRETGIKRALGATKSDVVIYYLIENWLVATLGIAFGIILALLLNVILIQGLGATRVDFSFLIPCIAFLWIMVLLATCLPAIKASSIPPAQATRSV